MVIDDAVDCMLWWQWTVTDGDLVMVDEIDLLCGGISRAMDGLMIDDADCCSSIDGPWVDGD